MEVNCCQCFNFMRGGTISEYLTSRKVNNDVVVRKGPAETTVDGDWNILTEMELRERNVTTIGFTVTSDTNIDKTI